MAGQPKKIKNANELISLWQQYCDEIVDNEYQEVPTQTNFSKWLTIHYTDIDRRTIYNSLNIYFPEIKREFEAIRADIMVQGAMLNKWNNTMSIFALKNWCSWTDKQSVNMEASVKNPYADLTDEELRNLANK